MTERPEESQIHGTWILEEMSTEFAGKAPAKHAGAEGTLMYDKDLKTVFARISRPDERQASGRLLFEYAGHYSFDPEQSNVIYHNLEWATNPKMLERPKMKREFSLATETFKTAAGMFDFETTEQKTLNIIGPSAEYPDAKIVIRWKKLEQ